MQIYRYLCAVIALVTMLHVNMYAITEAENNLMGAIHSGNVSEMLKILKTQKPDVNVEAPNGQTPLKLAIYRDDPKAVQLLINYGLQLPTDLQTTGSPENQAMQLLNNYAHMLSQARNNPTKLLFYQALEHGFAPVVKVLLEKGIPVNTDDLKNVKNISKDIAIVNQDTYKLIGELLARHLKPQLPHDKNKISVEEKTPGYTQA